MINLLLDIEKALRAPQREYNALAKAIEKQLSEDEELMQTLKARETIPVSIRTKNLCKVCCWSVFDANLILVFAQESCPDMEILKEDEIPQPQDLKRYAKRRISFLGICSIISRGIQR